MSPLDRALRDAFRALGDASLKLAELLSFEDPDRPEVWPNTGEPLTAERFQRMMHKDEPPEAPPTPKHVSYLTGEPIQAPARVKKRVSAQRHAASMGYDYEHWCKMVRRVRKELFKVDRKNLAVLLGLSETAVRQWEYGIAFASLPSRTSLERISAALHGVDIDSWRKPKCE